MSSRNRLAKVQAYAHTRLSGAGVPVLEAVLNCRVQELREIAKAPADLGIKLEPVGATLSSWKAIIKAGLQ